MKRAVKTEPTDALPVSIFQKICHASARTKALALWKVLGGDDAKADA